MERKSILSKVLLFGVIWGFLEVVLGGVLHKLAVPYIGRFMSSLGITVLYIGYYNGLKPIHLLWSGIVSAGMKLFDVALFTVVTVDILNPITGILSQALIFAIILQIAGEKFKTNWIKLFYTSLFVISAILIFSLIAGKIYPALLGLTMKPTCTANKAIIIKSIINTLVLWGMLSAVDLVYEKDVVKSFSLLNRLSYRPYVTVSVLIVLSAIFQWIVIA